MIIKFGEQTNAQRGCVSVWAGASLVRSSRLPSGPRWRLCGDTRCVGVATESRRSNQKALAGGTADDQDGGKSLRLTTEDSEKLIVTSSSAARCDHLRRHIGDVAGAQAVGRLEHFVNVVGSCNVVCRLGAAELTCRCRGFAEAISCHAAVAMSRGTASVPQRCIGQRRILVR